VLKDAQIKGVSYGTDRLHPNFDLQQLDQYDAPIGGDLTNSTLGSELAINITDETVLQRQWRYCSSYCMESHANQRGRYGLTSYTAGDLPYYATGTALSKLALAQPIKY
jgi:hypothetical protein